MAKTSKNNIYYNDDENSIADVLADMKELAESADEAIENAKYDDKQIKQDISNIEKKNEELKEENQTLKDQIPSRTSKWK